MSQEADVNNCFDAAFHRVCGDYPDPNKSMSDDYGFPVQQVQRILFLTSTYLSAKGYVFTPSPDLINKCSTETVLAVLQDVNSNTKLKGKLPLVVAAARAKPSAGKAGKGKPTKPA